MLPPSRCHPVEAVPPLVLHVKLQSSVFSAAAARDHDLLPLPPVHRDGAVLRHGRRHGELLQLLPSLLRPLGVKGLDGGERFVFLHSASGQEVTAQLSDGGSSPEGGQGGPGLLPVVAPDVEVEALARLVDVAVGGEDGEAVAAGGDGAWPGVPGGRLPAPHHGGGQRGDGEGLGRVTQPRVDHVHQADGPVRVVTAQGAEEEDEGVPPRVNPRVLGGGAKPWSQGCLGRRDVDGISRAVTEESFVNVDIDLLLLLLRLVNGVVICSQICYLNQLRVGCQDMT